jgi:phosphate:Na+ symporter
LIEEAFGEMNNNLEKEYMFVNAKKAFEIEMKINKMRNELKETHLESIESGNYKYNAGVIYSDLVAQNERLGDFMVNVSQAISEGNRKIT